MRYSGSRQHELGCRSALCQLEKISTHGGDDDELAQNRLLGNDPKGWWGGGDGSLEVVVCQLRVVRVCGDGTGGEDRFELHKELRLFPFELEVALGMLLNPLRDVPGAESEPGGVGQGHNNNGEGDRGGGGVRRGLRE